MTTQQLIAATLVYSVALAAVVYFTRLTGRRFAGALAGAVVVDGLGLWALKPFGEVQGWWSVRLNPSPSYRALFCLWTTVSTVPIFVCVLRTPS